MTDHVELPEESTAAAKTVIAVTMEESQPVVQPTPSSNEKKQALSVDIKLVAQMYDNADATADDAAHAVEQVQPRQDASVLVKLKVPDGYKNETLEIWHVKTARASASMTSIWLRRRTALTRSLRSIRSATSSSSPKRSLRAAVPLAAALRAAALLQAVPTCRHPFRAAAERFP